MNLCIICLAWQCPLWSGPVLPCTWMPGLCADKPPTVPPIPWAWSMEGIHFTPYRSDRFNSRESWTLATVKFKAENRSSYFLQPYLSSVQDPNYTPANCGECFLDSAIWPCPLTSPEACEHSGSRSQFITQNLVSSSSPGRFHLTMAIFPFSNTNFFPASNALHEN